MKKSRIFIGCVILLALLLGFSIYVKGAILDKKSEPATTATGETTITVDSVTASIKDENIIVPIKIENNTGICGATLTINYDDNLVLKDIAGGSGFSSLNMTPPGKYSENPITILWDGVDNDTTNGEIAVLTFTSLKKAGTYNIEVTSTKGGIIDGDLKPVQVTLVNGTVTVKEESSETTAEETTVEKTTAEETTQHICNHTGKTEVRNAKKATCKTTGYTGDTYCKDCGKKLKAGKKIALTSHKWSAWKTTKSATALAKGSRYRTCSVCKKKETQTIAKLKPTIKLSSTKKTIKKKKTYTLVISKLAKGDSVKSVTSSNKKIATVKKASKNKYSIKATSKAGKVTIKVTLASGKKASCAVTVK